MHASYAGETQCAMIYDAIYKRCPIVGPAALQRFQRALEWSARAKEEQLIRTKWVIVRVNAQATPINGNMQRKADSNAFAPSAARNYSAFDVLMFGCI